MLPSLEAQGFSWVAVTTHSCVCVCVFMFRCVKCACCLMTGSPGLIVLPVWMGLDPNRLISYAWLVSTSPSDHLPLGFSRGSCCGGGWTQWKENDLRNVLECPSHKKKKHPSSPNSASTFRIRQEWEMNIRSVSHLHLPYSQRWCCRCHVCHVFCWAAWGLSSLFLFLSRLSNLEHRGFFHLNLFYCCRFFF